MKMGLLKLFLHFFYHLMNINENCPTVSSAQSIRCIIAMGLDKKPTPPPKRVKEDRGRAASVVSPSDAPETKTERSGEDAERETSQEQHMESKVRAEAAAEEDKARDGTVV